MANRREFRSVLRTVALAMAMGLAGCASTTLMVDALPPPSFSGPVISPQAPPRPVTSVVVQRPAVVAEVPAGPREWIPAASPRPWKWIVIHHSATSSGSAAVFDKMHREKGWDELGYHFVIGNGTQSGNGQVEVGGRWTRQKWGAHAKTPDNRYNDFGIGICLVGNFDLDRPTPQQQQALSRLVAHLMRTYNIPASRVIGHSDTKPTDCPGRNLSLAQVRRDALRLLADSGVRPPSEAQVARGTSLLISLDE